MLSATELLRRDHRAMERLLERWEYSLKAPQGEGLVSLGEIFSEIQQHLAAHFAKEENVFYPALEPLLSTAEAAISKLTDDHTDVRETSAAFQELLSQAQGAAEPSASLRSDLATVGWALWNQIHHHIAVEESGLLAFADRELSAERQATLAHQMKSVGYR